jgi:hypothetical protein
MRVQISIEREMMRLLAAPALVPEHNCTLSFMKKFLKLLPIISTFF